MNLDRNSSIIMGDFNVDLTQKEEKGNELLRLTESYGLLQLITTPTRITNTSSTLIDHIYTNVCAYYIQSGCIEAGISDHLPVYAIFENFNCEPLKKVTKDLRNFRKFSKDSFCNDLSNAQWREIYDCTDPMKRMNYFILCFRGLQ